MLNQKIVLSYDDFHRKSFQGMPTELFKGVDKEFAFGLIDLLNRGEKEYGSTAGLRAFLARWFSASNLNAFRGYDEKIEEISSRKVFEGAGLVVFNQHSTLAFIEFLLLYLKDNTPGSLIKPTNEQMEINLLDAYLVINQGLNSSKNGFEDFQKSHPREAVYWLSMNKAFQYADLLDRNAQELFITEIGKATMLFGLLETHVLAKPILDTFLAKYDCLHWTDYLKAIAGMSAIGFDTANHSGNTLVEIDPQLPFYPTCLKILDQVSVDIEMAVISEDFLYLRNHPIHRQCENKYQILARRFFVEKIFRALYFELREINATLGIMSDTKFRTVFYTSSFSENTLFYAVLDKIFEQSPFKKQGLEMEMIDPGFGASDYIAFHKQSVFIFESKDILIKKEVKARLFIPEMYDEFRKKFYKDGTADKAVLQLARNVKKMIEGGYEKFMFSPSKCRFIYPLVVVHSEAFNILGLNQILAHWFKEACIEVGLSAKQRYKIKPVVIIDVGTLLYFQDKINKNKVGLGSIISHYARRTKMPLDPARSPNHITIFQERYMIPFSLFLDRRIKQIKRSGTPLSILSKVRKIFPGF